jgi:hypothetical protein
MSKASHVFLAIHIACGCGTGLFVVAYCAIQRILCVQRVVLDSNKANEE